MDQVMHEIFEVIHARGNVTPEETQAFFDASEDNDPVMLYELHIVGGINRIEDNILRSAGKPSIGSRAWLEDGSTPPDQEAP